ncbi:BLUF domain-containing protein [Undibacterium sp. Di24W]|uniref:BLUF domain-containing protein n=1 Tax=Undibacterium sp. Di24W TaxID=3413033 RepID=UPI003BEF85D1
MSLIQLVYVSRLRGDESVLKSIHSHAVRNNTAHTITGMLLYTNKRFLQVLEGDSKVVHATFAQIKVDSRHEHVTLLLEQKIEAHYFQHWNMGFRHLLDEELASFPAYAAYFEDDFSHFKAQPQIALEILKILGGY